MPNHPRQFLSPTFSQDDIHKTAQADAAAHASKSVYVHPQAELHISGRGFIDESSVYLPTQVQDSAVVRQTTFIPLRSTIEEQVVLVGGFVTLNRCVVHGGLRIGTRPREFATFHQSTLTAFSTRQGPSIEQLANREFYQTTSVPSPLLNRNSENPQTTVPVANRRRPRKMAAGLKALMSADLLSPIPSVQRDRHTNQPLIGFSTLAGRIKIGSNVTLLNVHLTVNPDDPLAEIVIPTNTNLANVTIDWSPGRTQGDQLGKGRALTLTPEAAQELNQ